MLTVGHGDRETGELEAVLQAAAVHSVVDVRSHPKSRRFPRFDRGALAPALADHGIEYLWLGRELGGQRRTSVTADAHHPALLSPGLRAFAAWMEGERFTDAVADLEARADERSIALLCAERAPERCHRWLIADYLVAVRGLAVAHLHGPGEAATAHRVSEIARADHGILRYDRGATAALDLGGHPE